MEQITFKEIYVLGQVVAEGNLYKHIHDPEMLLRYDSNFVEFKRMPSIEEFKTAEAYLRQFHLNHGQKHVKFYFPENEKPAGEIIDYMNDSCYYIGFLELYAIQPNEFPNVRPNPDIEIQKVSNSNFDQFLTLQFRQDLVYGSYYASQKQDLLRRNFLNPTILQVLALYKGIPSGSVDVIIADETAEIDNLVVDETYQKKGIGSSLQKFVMENLQNKTVILVADGEDTPKEMYRKQNYQFLGFKYYSQKAYEE
ncbi:GNAT family N-acetyltransferase [Bacillus sp. MRMR6]|uniref:GNAT family N-acetyltransferase n=1 Tax=Bacillus sp. MRMR6 TaxID=1928617 RepID=UPI000952379F|nr:GNAT family N-acetyltransferase [Bacillus sp. MRMR6]OLS33707.1 GNAT family N-acetyltransferase [Bacillus sp. MRMR6]